MEIQYCHCSALEVALPKTQTGDKDINFAIS